MNVFRKFPVATALAIVTGLGTVEQVAEGEHLIGGTEAGWCKLVLLALTIILGVLAHQASTPLADPKTADGTPLVPATPVTRPTP